MRSWYIRSALRAPGKYTAAFPSHLRADGRGADRAEREWLFYQGGPLARLNSDPYAGFHLFALVNRVTALLDSEEAVTATVRALEADGVATGDIEIFTGEEGAKVLDLPGREHGRAIHLLRALEATMGDERETNQRIDAALRKARPWCASRSRRRCRP